MAIKEYIKDIIREIISEDELDEMSTSGAVGAYSTPFAFKGKKKGDNVATKTAVSQGYTKASKRTEAYTATTFDEAKLKGSRRYIPNEFIFPSFLLEPINLGNESKIYFKIATNNKGESILMIDPLVKIALDATQRGRTSFDSEMKLPLLTRYMNEKIPNSVRGLIKKSSQGAKIVGNNFIPLNLILTKNIESTSSTSNNIKINSKGIQFLKDIKVDNSKGIGKEDEILLLVWLYKNQNKNTTPKDFSIETGESTQLASKIANNLISNNYVDVDKNIDTGDGKTWYIKNPYKSGDYEDINVSLYESIDNIVKEELLNEVTYNKFKNEVKLRSKNEALHKAIKEVKRKLMEIDRIVEYTSMMKQELSEGEEGLKYWKATSNNISRIAEMVNELNTKIQNLQQ
jgi:hypothetical protein